LIGEVPRILSEQGVQLGLIIAFKEEIEEDKNKKK
jgi:hypothetical protein